MTKHEQIHFSRILGNEVETASSEGDLIFPYWSFTKTVIAICALKLNSDGIVTLDLPVPGQPFTLRQLLSHTAGLPDYTSLTKYLDAVARDEEPWSRDELLEAALASGRLFEPGDGWSYSNVGYMLARDHIEQAAGTSFPTLCDQIICQPLVVCPLKSGPP